MTGQPRNIGIIGLGNMGLPMSMRLLAAGHEVSGYDADPSAVARLERAGGAAGAAAGAILATADVVILMLPNSDVVESVLREPVAGQNFRDGLVIVDMGSSEPLRTRALAEELASRGVTLLDAPVSGGVAGAVAGALTIMAGGDSDSVERLRPLLETFGSFVHVGPVGAGHAVKALNNWLSATHLWATSEAVEIGRTFGVDRATMIGVFNGSSGRSGSSEVKWPQYILPGTFDSGFGLRLMLKDIRIAMGLSQRLGRPTRFGESVAQAWAQAAEALPAEADHTEVAAWIAQMPAGGRE